MTVVTIQDFVPVSCSILFPFSVLNFKFIWPDNSPHLFSNFEPSSCFPQHKSRGLVPLSQCVECFARPFSMSHPSFRSLSDNAVCLLPSSTNDSLSYSLQKWCIGPLDIADKQCLGTLTLSNEQSTGPLALWTFSVILLGVGLVFMLSADCSAGPVPIPQQRSHHHFLRFEMEICLTCSLSLEQTKESHVCNSIPGSTHRNTQEIYASISLASSNLLLTYSVKPFKKYVQNTMKHTRNIKRCRS
jgi:hypothetical protein